MHVLRVLLVLRPVVNLYLFVVISIVPHTFEKGLQDGPGYGTNHVPDDNAGMYFHPILSGLRRPLFLTAPLKEAVVSLSAHTPLPYFFC